MGTAKSFSPRTILLSHKVAKHPEAQRILNLFPAADVRVIENQQNIPLPDMSPSQSLLAGKRTLMIGRTTSFIAYSDGRLGKNIRCRPYYKLVPVSNGCPYYCTYCHPAIVTRRHSPFIKINVNHDAMFRQIRETISDTLDKISFNMGEMLDSLALDHITNLTTMLVPFFSKFSKGFLILLTKSSNIDNLLAVEPNGQTILSWSLNSKHAIHQYELGTADLDDRIEAARRCQEHGYRIRLRIDPGILHQDWQADYADLIRKALTSVKAENITLGMLRLLQGNLRLAESTYGQRARKLREHALVKEPSDRKLRYPPKERVQFYKFLIDTIRSFDKDVPIGLCRETSEIWNTFKNHCKPAKCNCVTW